ncbi:hypothetical protein ES319_D09G150600v1 [Gossypium barbadense]|uniref:DUF7148 domain-containing protein n=2 Tax=Gossypium TaxID=3633 RepID=A0A0D2QAJ7_GOSRA|nr:hypothetical protein ES319_D09G150600v1 [Gossypium barbadense]KJB36333.1 hypothetical protein B456_006G153100 [Gossypium raimondii]
MAGALRQPLHSTTSAIPPLQLSKPRATGISPSPALFLKDKTQGSSKLSRFYGHRSLIVKLVGKASPGKDDITPAADDPENGVSLGTMKLPSNTDIQRFETLLFQWANSLCQGANLPLPVPLKVCHCFIGILVTLKLFSFFTANWASTHVNRILCIRY